MEPPGANNQPGPASPPPASPPPADTPPAPPPGKFRAWLQLLRVPNLFTVPGDPIAGYLLALTGFYLADVGRGARLIALEPWNRCLYLTPWNVLPNLRSMLFCILASLLLYAGGLLLNDYSDLEEDRRDRPSRPLPAGLVSPATVLTVGLLLLAGGVASAWLAHWDAAITAVVLAPVIVGYDVWLKKLPVIGPITMGLCRGLSLLLGATAAVGWRGLLAHANPEIADLTALWPAGMPAFVAALGVTLYIAAVTQVARTETTRRSLGLVRYLPLAAVVVLAASMLVVSRRHILDAVWCAIHSRVWLKDLPEFVPYALTPCVAFACLVWCLLNANRCAAALKGSPEPKVVQQTVGRLILNLLVVQGMLIAYAHPYGFLGAGVLCLIFLPAARRTARHFYGS